MEGPRWAKEWELPRRKRREATICDQADSGEWELPQLEVLEDSGWALQRVGRPRERSVIGICVGFRRPAAPELRPPPEASIERGRLAPATCSLGRDETVSVTRESK